MRTRTPDVVRGTKEKHPDSGVSALRIKLGRNRRVQPSIHGFDPVLGHSASTKGQESHIRSFVQAFELRDDDRLLGVLPT